MDDPLTCPQDVAQAAPEVCENEQRLLVARRDNFPNKLSGPAIAPDQRQNELGRGEGELWCG